MNKVPIELTASMILILRDKVGISTTKKKPSPINRLEPDSTAVGIATNRIVQLIDANTKEMKKDQIEPYKTFRGEKRKT